MHATEERTAEAGPTTENAVCGATALSEPGFDWWETRHARLGDFRFKADELGFDIERLAEPREHLHGGASNIEEAVARAAGRFAQFLSWTPMLKGLRLDLVAVVQPDRWHAYGADSAVLVEGSCATIDEGREQADAWLRAWRRQHAQ